MQDFADDQISTDLQRNLYSNTDRMPMGKKICIEICDVFGEVLDLFEDSSSMTKSVLLFLDVPKRSERHLSVGTKIIPIASQKVFFSGAKHISFFL